MSHHVRPPVAHVNWSAELERSQIIHIHRDFSSHPLSTESDSFFFKGFPICFTFKFQLWRSYSQVSFPHSYILISCSPYDPACITTIMHLSSCHPLAKSDQRQKSLITSDNFFFFCYTQSYTPFPSLFLPPSILHYFQDGLLKTLWPFSLSSHTTEVHSLLSLFWTLY